MRRFAYRKLVRDGIVPSMLAGAEQPEYKKLAGKELFAALRDKVVEEAGEMKPDDAAELASELADLQEALDALARTAGIPTEDIARIQEQKRLRVGGFEKGFFVETVSVPPDNPWISYLEQHPDRYPELP